MKINLKIKKEFDAKFLIVSAGVRYWEDSSINGKEDTEGDLIPFRNGDYWEPIIDIDNGIVVDWPKGTFADIHYKVCDDGSYEIRDSDNNYIKAIDGYVPSIMCPEENGYGDYIIMMIDSDGKISKWKPDLKEFK